MASQVVKVRKELLAACVTCPLCNKLFRDATTVSECLHTFCRKCIYNKLTEEEFDCCPICNTDLGPSPVEKLRPDHNLQDVRAKVFPSKRQKLDDAEVISASPLPLRRKERSLSSLVVSAPRVSSKRRLTGRRSKAIARKVGSLRDANFPSKESIEQEEDSSEDRFTTSGLRSSLNKNLQNKRQNLSAGDSADNIYVKDLENGGERWSPKGNLWKPLNCLVEAANRTKSFKPSSAAKSEQSNGSDRRKPSLKIKFRDKLKSQEEKNGGRAAPLGLRKTRKFKKKANTSKELRSSAQALFESAGFKLERRFDPIWCSLVASSDQHGGAPLPQISPAYLRIKDGSLPVSFIRKYLVKKMNLSNEDEAHLNLRGGHSCTRCKVVKEDNSRALMAVVEITCQGQQVKPSMTLYNLADIWLKAVTTSRRVATSVGASAKDFVMSLTYSRTSLATRHQNLPAQNQ